MREGWTLGAEKRKKWPEVVGLESGLEAPSAVLPFGVAITPASLMSTFRALLFCQKVWAPSRTRSSRSIFNNSTRPCPSVSASADSPLAISRTPRKPVADKARTASKPRPEEQPVIRKTFSEKASPRGFRL